MADARTDLVESLKQSAANRAAMVEKFGFVPRSVIREIVRGKLTEQLFVYQREYVDRSGSAKSRMGRRAGGEVIPNVKSEAAREKVKLRAQHRLLGGVLDVKKNGARMAASTMPAELVAFFVKYYARPGDTYLDPFMGQGIQMQVAHMLGLHYYGYDCAVEFYRYIEAVAEKIHDGTTALQVTLGDSRTPTTIPDGIGDFCFTSPPYWDIEYYGEEPEQLGYRQTYPDFLASMEQVYRAWLPKFKAGAVAVINVNDFRKGGQLYTYHADTIALLRSAGWRVHDIWIIEGLVGGLPKAFAVDFNMKRIAPKLHEYAITVVRP